MQLNLNFTTHQKLPKTVSRLLILNLSISLALLLIAIIYLPKAQPELPLLYTLNQARGPMVNKWLLLTLPSIALGLNLVNLIFTFGLLSVLSRLMLELYAAVNLVITLIFVIAMLRIIYVTW